VREFPDYNIEKIKPEIMAKYDFSKNISFEIYQNKIRIL
jgi:hypothetical protein